MHEMNLDWILLKVKEMIAEWDTTKNAWTELKNFVETYFENLDVQQEINNKLDEMASGGELAELMQPYLETQLPIEVANQIGDVVALQISSVVAAQLGDVVADQLPAIAADAAAAEVSDWLAAHVDPETGYVLDSSLTVEGAAADAKAAGDAIGVIQGVSSGADLNDLTTRGFYQLAFAGTFTNSPLASDANIHKMLEVFVRGTTIFQRFSAYKHSSPIDYQEFFRIYDGSQWRAWQRGIGAADFASMVSSFPDLVANMSDNGSEVSGTDLDTVTDRGFYRLAYAGSFTNSPVADADEVNRWKFLQVLKDDAQFYQIYTIHAHGSGYAAQYMRVNDGDGFKNWTKCFDNAEIAAAYAHAIAEDTVKESFSPTSEASQGANSGMKLRVCTYNVANYNNDTATYISDNKLLNFRKMLYEVDADVLFTQEDRQYVDSGSSNESKNYLYYPKYPYLTGTGGNTIKTKVSVTNDLVLRLSGMRSLRSCLLTSGSVKLLLITTHPTANYDSTGVTSAESIAERLIEYQEILGWANGDVSLNRTDGGGAEYAPTHTHVIIGLDANTITDDDKTNLQTLAASNDFILANGGYLGWFVTNPRHDYSIDNIIVSENVIINNVVSMNTKYLDLYSDHVPVYADVTLI